MAWHRTLASAVGKRCVRAFPFTCALFVKCINVHVMCLNSYDLHIHCVSLAFTDCVPTIIHSMWVCSELEMSR